MMTCSRRKNQKSGT